MERGMALRRGDFGQLLPNVIPAQAHCCPE
jgi:hypothetical protein